jgi:hypothetical protein
MEVNHQLCRRKFYGRNLRVRTVLTVKTALNFPHAAILGMTSEDFLEGHDLPVLVTAFSVLQELLERT